MAPSLMELGCGGGVGDRGPSGPELPSVSAKLVSSFLPSFGKTSLSALKKCDLCSHLVNSGRGKLGGSAA